jgi:hypothetical protein
MNAQGARAGNADALPADLPAIAVGAMQYAPSPELAHSRHIRELVGQPGREQRPAGPDRSARGEADFVSMAGRACGGSAVLADAGSIVLGLPPAGSEQFQGWDCLLAEDVVRAGCGSVPGSAGIDDGYRTERTGQRDGGAGPPGLLR